MFHLNLSTEKITDLQTAGPNTGIDATLTGILYQTQGVYGVQYPKVVGELVEAKEKTESQKLHKCSMNRIYELAETDIPPIQRRMNHSDGKYH